MSKTIKDVATSFALGNSASTTNVVSTGDMLLSRFKPVAVRYLNESIGSYGGARDVILTSRTYSVTTSQHTQAAATACRGIRHHLTGRVDLEELGWSLHNIIPGPRIIGTTYLNLIEGPDGVMVFLSLTSADMMGPGYEEAPKSKHVNQWTPYYRLEPVRGSGLSREELMDKLCQDVRAIECPIKALVYVYPHLQEAVGEHSLEHVLLQRELVFVLGGMTSPTLYEQLGTAKANRRDDLRQVRGNVRYRGHYKLPNTGDATWYSAHTLT